MEKIKIIYGLEAVGGGALKHLTYLVTHLNRDMYDITVVLSNQRNENANQDIEKIKNSSTKVLYVPICRKINIVKDCIILSKIYKILKKDRFDIIHAHSSKAGGLFRLAAFLAGNKNILYTPHSFYFQGLEGIKKKLFIGLEKLLAKITTYIIVSEGETNEILKNKIIGENYVLNINNAIDFNDYKHSFEINDTLEKYNIPAGKFIVGSVGRLTVQKDWGTFVFAANEVLKKHPETIFIIAGEGELRNEIQELIFTLGLEKRIVLTGYVREIHKIFGVIDIFVSTSLWEGLPYVILEAMNYKKPIITTDTCNEGVVCHEKSGFITPVKDFKTIAQKINELIEDKQKTIQMGLEGNEILTLKYSFKSFIDNHESLYNKCVIKK